MKHISPVLSVFLLAICITTSSAQVSSDYAVLLTATVTENPATITVKWNNYTDATGYTVYRKPKTSLAWGSSVASLPATATDYTDNNVAIDSGYEYKVVRTASSGITAEGYIYSGIKLHATDYRGKCLLVVDTTVSASMENELLRMMKDISGDGYAVKRLNVSRNDAVPFVKSLIVNEHNADPDVSSVLLFGHVPVPYSGDINPDGHPDHLGAWSCDAFYGEIDGTWTDNIVSDISASRPENQNIPGDGKYDQSIIPGAVDLQVGRVDLTNMPSFIDSEKVLLKNYLDKDHAFRTGAFTAQPRGLVDDNFGAFGGEAFASCGWRNFAPMFGDTAIHEVDYISTMQQNSYLWSYGCGGGWYQGAGGVGATTDFANDTIQTVFTMLFGSYFGDWDSPDNFLRAPLASKNRALTCCWAGRPYWFFHWMALGDNIGWCGLRSQNNVSTYTANYGAHFAHVALMGDPTLHQLIVKSPSNISLSLSAGYYTTVGVSWDPSPDPVDGYYVYRSNSEFGKYDRISPAIVTSVPFVDMNPVNGLSWYMVRAVKLEETPSGSYYNLSEGISDSVSAVITSINQLANAENNFTVFPNPASEKVWVQASSSNQNPLLEISDALGRIIFQQRMNDAGITIDVSEFPSGIYFVKMNDVVKKLVVE